ncbi:MAG: hypothetical protein V4733_03425 [Verrucomicrobiota bacterium]
MKTLLVRMVVGASVATSALVTTSCYYDPAVYGSTGYVHSPSVHSAPANYSYGYGTGYGYGHPRFSTSFFVSTGDPRWGYDPYSYAYYDYHSHRYYDPYLSGYYPYGYRPYRVYGVPHVHGYRHGFAPPPRYIRNHLIVGYRDRIGAYQRSNYRWGRNVRSKPVVIGNRPERRSGTDNSPRTGNRSSRNENPRNRQTGVSRSGPPRRDSGMIANRSSRDSSAREAARRIDNRNQGARNVSRPSTSRRQPQAPPPRVQRPARQGDQQQAEPRSDSSGGKRGQNQRRGQRF